jgi:hypothetical protein
MTGPTDCASARASHHHAQACTLATLHGRAQFPYSHPFFIASAHKAFAYCSDVRPL